ncbi:MAG TPA: HAD family hydrolase [Blastocatellia bacterium]|nr:HAD family hydrolase [Blastocatellia bacterium]
MRYLALACDYDGTLALHGTVDEPTVEALERARSSGRKLILVSGRLLDDLMQVFPRLDLFDRVVAENGALLYHPEKREERVLAERPPEKFAEELSRRGVGPLGIGRVIIGTWHPHENAVLEAIRDLGLELQVTFNKGAVMILPSGINKATGLSAALGELGLSPHNVAAVGDAENDHALLTLCECAVAVANALPALKESADWVTERDHGAGVRQLIESLIETDLGWLEERLARHDIPLGIGADGSEFKIRPYGESVLLAGSSQGGKTTLATGLIERLLERRYQVCVLDPEGDYSELEQAIVLGDGNKPPTATEVTEVLAKPEASLAANLLGIGVEHRPDFFAQLFPRLQELRVRRGRPHWIVLDETHHLLPANWEAARLALPQAGSGFLMITVKPEHVAREALALATTVIAIGESPEQTIRIFCESIGEPPPRLDPIKLEKGDALVWSRRTKRGPIWIRSHPPSGVRKRHHRKYAQGELSPELSFYFRGPDNRLNLRAQNLRIFLQLADGVDDETWLHHLRQREYSRWFRQVIKDDHLADEAARVEEKPGLSAGESRQQIRLMIEKRYTREV